MVCFIRQFGHTVTKDDYLALRMGFIRNHRTNEKYNFHSYVIRSLEDEFKDIVGVSFSLWVFVVAFMLFNIHGVNLYVWLAIIPVILILLVGAKLQHVIATLALESAGIQGRYDPEIRPRDDLFWLNRPQMMLALIHFILFQNSFELATFFWALWQFGINTCLLRKHKLVYGRLISGFVVQIFCSYSTLPLYALVIQMGSSYKKAIFKESVVESLHGWRKKARRKAKLGVVHEESGGASIEHDNGGSSNTLMDRRIREDASSSDEIEVELEDSVQSSQDTFRNQSLPIFRAVTFSPRPTMEMGRSSTTRN